MDAFVFWTHNRDENDCALLQSPLSLYLMLIFEQLTQRKISFFANLQHWIEGKEDNKNIKVDFLVLH